ncbi:MAG: hypothetical protein AAGG01_10760 [Planctomycetota bacterium]
MDDVGDLLFLVGRGASIGHVASAEPDLGLLGDIDALHARLALTETFHSGLAWSLSVVPGAAAVRVDGKAWGAGMGPRPLRAGDRVEFGEAASFLCRQTDPSSASMVLELERRSEIQGCRRVVLLVPELAGRVRFGRHLRRHVVIPGLSHDVAVLAHVEGREAPLLTVACEGGVRRVGGASGAVEGAGETDRSASFGLPIEQRVDLALGAAPDRMPPFGMALRPIAPR